MPPKEGDACYYCLTRLTQATADQPRYKCRDCYPMPSLCSLCATKIHTMAPFHRILRWNVQLGIWDKVTATDLGVRLYAGHGGRPCPRISRAPRLMCAVHSRGVMKIPVSFCECASEVLTAQRQVSRLRVSEPIQLLRLGLYPASWSTPRTFFTLGVMQEYHLLSLQGNMSAQDFYTSLARMTDNVAPHDLPDRYREFMASMREFTFLRACKRGGQTPRRNMPARSLAVLCPACPQPNINMRPDWHLRSPEFRYLDALFYAIDGNYHQHQRKKPLDPNDFALTAGAAYFANEADFRKYLQMTGDVEPEESTCNKFGAMGPGGYTHPVSGILAISCRHELVLPQSIIDLISNEKAHIVDFAVVSATQAYITLRLLKQYYDVNCQYMVRMPIRLADMAKLLPLLGSITTTRLPTIEGAVPAFHQYAHREQCQSFQSPNCLPGSGKYDGETNERKWNQTNASARRSREMVSGGRHDFINDLLSDINVRNVHNMGKGIFLQKHDDAVKYHSEAKAYLVSVEAKIPPEVLQQWKDDHAAWLEKVVDIKNHKTLDNPFVARKDDGLSRASVGEALKSSAAAPDRSYGMELVGAIEGMVNLDKERLELINQVASTDGTKARQCSAMAARVDAFLAKARTVDDIYSRYVNPLVAAAFYDVQRGLLPPGLGPLPSCLPWRDEEDDRRLNVPTPVAIKPPILRDTFLASLVADIMDVDIYLPSLYHSLIRHHPALAPAVAIERELRQGEAHDALNELRLQIMARHSLRDLDDQGAGQAHGKRVREMEERHLKAANQYRDEYARIRTLLLALGVSHDDATFRELKEEDCSAITEKRKIGDSRKTRSWLWADLSILTEDVESDVKAFMLENSRPHWFRCSAAEARWHEEVYLKREEMYRTLLFFAARALAWHTRALEADQQGQLGTGAYARRQAHRYERLSAAAKRIYPECISEVILICRLWRIVHTDGMTQGVGMPGWKPSAPSMVAESSFTTPTHA
ncbi:hypothetical protein C8Q76DRAFT_623155 [Earliella scabrosa]|nr:hypothetical protein C8Q76DRAFT_623155 [Earliella scabrosa]